MIYEPPRPSRRAVDARAGRALAIGLVGVSLLAGLVVSYALGPYCESRTGWPCLPRHAATGAEATASATLPVAAGTPGAWPGIALPTPLAISSPTADYPFGLGPDSSWGVETSTPPYEAPALPPTLVPLPTTAMRPMPLPSVPWDTAGATAPWSTTATPSQPTGGYPPRGTPTSTMSAATPDTGTTTVTVTTTATSTATVSSLSLP